MRRQVLFSILLATAGLLLSGVTAAGNGGNDRKINVDLTGFEECLRLARGRAAKPA